MSPLLNQYFLGKKKGVVSHKVTQFFIVRCYADKLSFKSTYSFFLGSRPFTNGTLPYFFIFTVTGILPSMNLKLITGTSVLSAIFCFTQFSCVSNSEEDLYGIEIYDTSSVTWEYPIREILEHNCVICHNPEKQYGGVRHDTYTEELKVVNDGRLRGVVNHLPTYVRMPYQRAQLPNYELEVINSWLDKGAPEN